MAEKGELKVGDMVRYWARTPTSSLHLDGFVGQVHSTGHDGICYIRWLMVQSPDYGADVQNLDKIDLLP